jgi:hypothetical protein
VHIFYDKQCMVMLSVLLHCLVQGLEHSMWAWMQRWLLVYPQLHCVWLSMCASRYYHLLVTIWLFSLCDLGTWPHLHQDQNRIGCILITHLVGDGLANMRFVKNIWYPPKFVDKIVGFSNIMHGKWHRF